MIMELIKALPKDKFKVYNVIINSHLHIVKKVKFFTLMSSFPICKIGPNV